MEVVGYRLRDCSFAGASDRPRQGSCLRSSAFLPFSSSSWYDRRF